MLKQAIIIILAIFCCFSIIPLSWIIIDGIIYSGRGAMISIALLLIVLGFAAYDFKKLFDNKEYRLAKHFFILLILSIIISFTIIAAIWPYVRPLITV